MQQIIIIKLFIIRLVSKFKEVKMIIIDKSYFRNSKFNIKSFNILHSCCNVVFVLLSIYLLFKGGSHSSGLFHGSFCDIIG